MLALASTQFTAEAFHNPTTGRWLNRDPIAERGGLNLYEFTLNNPLTWVDLWGLRNVTITMYFTNLTIDQCVKDEVNRILQNCMKKCCSKNNKVSLNWIPFGGTPNQLPLGGSGGNLFGFNPTNYSVAVVGSAGGWFPGITGGGYFSPGDIISISTTALQTAANNAGVSLCKALALTIAHEAFHHAIGGTWGHFSSTGYVDSSTGKPGGGLSSKACKELCGELDVD
jgi:uncharacterized protein RhaS with RHS repeats